MKYFGIYTLLVVLLMPFLAFGDTIRIINNVSARSQTGNVTTVVSDGKDGESVSSSVTGADGADGEDGVVTESRSSSRVDVYTEVNGKVIEDSHTVVENGDESYEQTRVYEKDNVKVETSVKASASGQKSSGISDLQDKKDEVEKKVSEVAPITSQHITENADTAVTEAIAERQTEPFIRHTVNALHRIFSDIYSYVSNIFTSSGENLQPRA